ncbi:MAG: hypothetical protein ABSB01_14725 [Streptosporangiaceae bacterium]|jgi:hypothetical protein
MSQAGRILKVVLLAGTAAGIVFAVVKLRRTRELALQTVSDIEAQIDALDPVTRAAVVAKLSADAAKDVKARSG